LEAILRALLQRSGEKIPADDRAIIEAELNSEASREYWESEEFERRLEELQSRFDDGTTMTMQGAAEFLNVPFAVFQWFFADGLREEYEQMQARR
jgi:hypothetical protein